MLIGYTAFRNLSVGKTVKEKSVREELCDSLQVILCLGAKTIEGYGIGDLEKPSR